MHHTFTAIAILLITVGISHAGEAEDQANSFINIYAATCLKHITDLDSLRIKLKSAPELPAEKAALFLAGHAGDAWPVPNKHGLFVIAIPSDINMCMVYARRADTTIVESSFKKIVEKSPRQLDTKKLIDEHRDTDSNGPTHTVSYEWSVKNAPRKMLFTLTTANSTSAQLQVMGSAALTRE